MWLKNKLAAFTLLEALISLLVISGSLLLFQSMSQLLSVELHYQKSSQQTEWLLFADQLETELAGSQLEKVEDNKLYILQNGKSIALGKSKADDFRKTDARGRGYQPMVKGLESARIEEKGENIWIHVQFKGGLERDFVYRMEKAD